MWQRPARRTLLQSLTPPEAIWHLVPPVERTSQAHRQGATETAERLCLDVLELAPDRPGALSILSDMRKGALVPRSFHRVGVIWAGRPARNNDRNRSALLTDLQPPTDVSGVALVALQKGPRTEQAGAHYGRAPLINIGAEIGDYGDTMGILDNLDLLVTVEPSVAHLAGAMGRPVWIMLPRAPDWRWLLDRSDTPWYPSMRLFRQQSVRHWDDVAQAIAAELAVCNWEDRAII